MTSSQNFLNIFFLYKMPNNPYDLIIGSIYIGGKEAVEKHNSKFTLIVNCSNAVQCPPSPESILFSVVNSVNDVTKYFNMIKDSNVLERLRDCVLKNKAVLVNCTEGMHRSCTMVACYLMKYENMNVDQTMKFIKSKRSIAFNPVFNLRGVLEMFYNHIKPFVEESQRRQQLQQQKQQQQQLQRQQQQLRRQQQQQQEKQQQQQIKKMTEAEKK